LVDFGLAQMIKPNNPPQPIIEEKKVELVIDSRKRKANVENAHSVSIYNLHVKM